MPQASHIQHSRKAGVSLVEVVVGSAIILMITLAIVTLYSRYIRAVSVATESMNATLLAREGIESMRYLRDTGWDSTLGSYSVNTDYYVIATSTTLVATTTSQPPIYGTFDRTIVLEEVYRDGNNNIAGSGTLDTHTRKVTATVEWLSNNATSTKTFSAYLTRFKD